MGTRRRFILNSALVTTAMFTSARKGFSYTEEAERVKSAKSNKQLKLGVAGYSLRYYNLDDALIKMQKMNVHYLSIKDFHLPLGSTDAEIAGFHQKLKAARVIGYAVGPIYTKDEKEIDRAFDYAKRVGVDLIIGVPQPQDLPYVAKKCQEFNIRLGIHNHGPQDKVYPNATVVYNYVKDLDPRLGLCLDMGHDKRDKQDPLKDFLRYKHRVFDLHFKNVDQDNIDGKTTELDRGIMNIPVFIKGLAKAGYQGVSSLEYEEEKENPIPALSESIGYFKGVCDCQGIKVL